MRLSVVICTYDRYDLLSEALAALAAQTMAPDDFEILVVDNSPDAKRSAAESGKYKKMSNLTWHHLDRPGLSNARNFGTGAAKGEIVAFLDDDALAVPGWAKAMVEAFDALGPGIAAVGGRVTPLFRAPRPGWLSDKLLSHLSMVDLGDERRPIAAGEWVVGANIAYRRDLLAETGGFSTNLGRIGGLGLLSAEETEVAARLYANGYEIAYDPQAQVEHIVDASRTTQAWFARRIAWQAVSALLAGETGSAEDIAHAAVEIRRYFAALHPADRHIGALTAELETPEELDWQYGTIYNVIVLLLAGGRAGPVATPAAETSAEPPASTPIAEAPSDSAEPAPPDATPAEEPAHQAARAVKPAGKRVAKSSRRSSAVAKGAAKKGGERSAARKAPASPPPAKSPDDA